MSKTAQTLNKLPDGAHTWLELMKDDYKTLETEVMRKEYRTMISGFVTALYRVGLITDVERRLLFTWAVL